MNLLKQQANINLMWKLRSLQKKQKKYNDLKINHKSNMQKKQYRREIHKFFKNNAAYLKYIDKESNKINLSIDNILLEINNLNK